MDRGREYFIALLTILLSLGGASARAVRQANPADDLVRINVLALDAQNRPALDVKQEEVQVFEDGSPQTISYFSKDEVPLNYCIVVDSSGSVKNYVNQILYAAVMILTNHKPGDDVALIEFKDQPELLAEFSPDRRAALANLEALRGTATRQTALIDAVYLAVKYVAEYKPVDRISRRVVIVITDGDERDSYYKLNELRKHVSRENIQVFAIGYDMNELAKARGKGSEKKARELLMEITRETGGLAYFPDDESQLRAVAGEILWVLRTQYVIGYKPSGKRKAGSGHTISVTISDAPGRERRTAITRAGYIEK